MRHTIHVLCLSGLVLSSCVRMGALSSDDVLRRTALEAQKLTSARFELTGDFSIGTADRAFKGSFHAPGVLQDQGKTFQAAVDVTGSSMSEGESTSYTIKGDLIALLHTESYIRLQSIAFNPFHVCTVLL